MTEKLYDANSYLKDFYADVVSCEQNADGSFSVILNKTAFFPEEGGQCSDTGVLGNAFVSYVCLKPNGEIVHITDKALSGKVSGSIDFAKRFRNMQNHTGEHILSGLIFKKYGFNNVGFHLGETDVTMDIDGILSREQLNEIELLANKAVAANLKVTGYYPKRNELADLNYRSKKEIDGDIRIVNIEGIDDCACCAPHVARTGEIGIIKILDFFKMRGGTRLNIKCGFDALLDYREKYKNIYEISVLLKSPQADTAQAVEQLYNENKQLSFKIGELKRQMILNYSCSIKQTSGNLCVFQNDLNGDDLRQLANALKDKCGGLCVVLSGDDKNGYSYCIASNTIDLKEKIGEINKTLLGKGGGQSMMMFGSFSAKQEDIKKYFEVG